MKIERKYRCLDCGHRFKRVFTITGGMDDALIDPPCPKCAHQPAEVPQRISAPAIVGTKGRAVDAAYAIAEQDYGLTNMRDNAKEGETAFIPPPAEKPENITRPSMLWGGAGPASGPVQMPGVANLMANARGAAAMAKAEGKSPMQMLHQARPKLRAMPLNHG